MVWPTLGSRTAKEQEQEHRKSSYTAKRHSVILVLVCDSDKQVQPAFAAFNSAWRTLCYSLWCDENAKSRGGGFGNNNAALRNALNFFFQREREFPL